MEDAEVDVEEMDVGENPGSSTHPVKEQFAQSLKALDQVCQILACVKCEAIPAKDGDKVFTLGNCFHKYCESCAETLIGKPCLAVECKAVGRPVIGLEDAFSSSLIASLMKLKGEMLALPLHALDNLEIDEDAPLLTPMKDSDDEESDGHELPRSAGLMEGSHNNDQGATSGIALTLTNTGRVSTDLDENAKGNKIFRVSTDIHSPPAISDRSSPSNEETSITTSEDLENAPAITSKLKTTKKGRISPDIGDVSATTSKAAILEGERHSPNIDERTLIEPASALKLAKKRRKKSALFNPVGSSTPIRSEGGKISPGIIDSPISSVQTSSSTPKSIKSIQSESTTPVPVKRGRKSSDSSNQRSLDNSTTSGSTSFTSTSGKVDKKNSKGETALHVACRTGQLEKAKQCIFAGADPNIQDYAGWTPLHEAITGKASPSCKLDLVKLLFESGSCNLNIPGMDDESAIHEASRGGLQDIVVYLLDHGASPNVRNRLGKLPRDDAATKEIIKIFDDAAVGTSAVSPDASLVDDPVVLGIQLSKALIYFNYDVSPEVISNVEQILKLKVSKTLRDEVTHIIFSSDGFVGKKKGKKVVTFSFEYLYGIASGSWMLSSEWINKSIQIKEILSPCAFEIEGCNELDAEANAPSSSRVNKELGNPGLLDGFCFYFYKNSAFENIGKKNLSMLVKLAGGQVINREPDPSTADPLTYPTRFHVKQDNDKLVLTAYIILYDDKNKPPAAKMHNMEHIKVLTTKWLTQSLGNFQLKDPDDYLTIT